MMMTPPVVRSQVTAAAHLVAGLSADTAAACDAVIVPIGANWLLSLPLRVMTCRSFVNDVFAADAAGSGRPARRRSKPAAFWMTNAAASSSGAPDYREETASPAPSAMAEADDEHTDAIVPAEQAAPPDSTEGTASAAAGESDVPDRPSVLEGAKDDATDEGGSPAAVLPADKDVSKVRALCPPGIHRQVHFCCSA